jgi:hypothetical protein
LPATYTLQIAGLRQGSIFRLHEKALRRAMQQFQLLAKQYGPFFWQRLNQVYQHGVQAPVDLNARAAKVTDFGDGQLDEVFPVRRPIEESELPLFISGVTVNARVVNIFLERWLRLCRW